MLALGGAPEQGWRSGEPSTSTGWGLHTPLAPAAEVRQELPQACPREAHYDQPQGGVREHAHPNSADGCRT